jgi:hypothetical protein
MKDSKPFDASKFPSMGWPELEKMSQQGCECCNEPFSLIHPVGLSPKCHPGLTMVNYWDGVFYFSCGKCEAPICKVAVSRSLL